MTQLVQPNLTFIGEAGECLHYAGMVFGISSGPDTAWEAWQQTTKKHLDQNFPSGVSFPVWFSGAGGAGHVCVFTPKGIYSSPWDFQTGHQVWTSISQVEQKYGVKYVGWSEDIEGKKVIKEDIVLDQEHLNILNFAFFGGDKAPPAGLTLGRPYPDSIVALNNSPERKARIAKLNQQELLAEQSGVTSTSAVTLKPGVYKVN
jgi:hypothetical protein